MTLHTVFLREDCTLPDRLDLGQEPFCEGWTSAVGVLAPELDARIRHAGWHFMWMTDSYSCRRMGKTSETAIHQALVSALKKVKRRFNAAELRSIQTMNCMGLRIANVTLDARQIQKHASLDSAVGSRLKEVLAH